MGNIQFLKKQGRSSLLDPAEGYVRKDLSFELRTDPLTGRQSRILTFRRRKLPGMEIPLQMIEASQAGCPFCPDRVLTATPRFIADPAPGERMKRGRAVMFPNSFPYALHNWVVVFSEDHFLPLERFSVETLRDAFLLARDGILRTGNADPLMRYASINWNYLPQSGGGLFHPHLQSVLEEVPTVSHREVLKGLDEYLAGSGSGFWKDFLAEEIRRGERYIGRCGDVHFVSAFSPRGILGEVVILFPERTEVEDLEEEVWDDFFTGLTCFFKYLVEKKIFSFNLSLFFGGPREAPSWIYGRVCPRMTLPPWNTSDINYFEKLHGEVICVVSPEELCAELKPFFV